MEFFTFNDWLGISVVIFIMGMSKGGFPVAGIALPLLVLLWPEQGKAARSAVSFMLPLLCTMDVFGAWMYRKHINWQHIKSLLPGMLLGVLVASIFFITEQGLAVSDRSLKLIIGLLGISFSTWHLLGKPSFKTPKELGSGLRPWLFGTVAGLTSTIAHAAGPVMQMYLLPCRLSKEIFAGTTVYFFLILNGVKLIPFAIFGRLNKEQILGNLWRLPLIPAGVLAGYTLVRIMKEKHYIQFIQFSLLTTSFLLIIKSLSEF